MAQESHKKRRMKLVSAAYSPAPKAPLEGWNGGTTRSWVSTASMSSPKRTRPQVMKCHRPEVHQMQQWNLGTSAHLTAGPGMHCCRYQSRHGSGRRKIHRPGLKQMQSLKLEKAAHLAAGTVRRCCRPQSGHGPGRGQIHRPGLQQLFHMKLGSAAHSAAPRIAANAQLEVCSGCTSRG